MLTKVIEQAKIDHFTKWFERADKIVIVSHVSPDGDAIGSSLGLYHFLDSQEKTVNVIVPNAFPDFLRWMPGSKDILLYANYWFTKGGHNEADYAEQARAVKAAGFTGLKFDPFAHTNYFYGEDLASNLTLTPAQQDLAFNVSKAVREAVGPEVDIMIETHAMLNYRIAVKMAERLSKLDIAWYEEPAGPESSQTLRAMRERIPSDVSICVGERHYTRFGIRSLLEKHVCDIIMPDITRCGGPSEMKRMATMAEAYNVLLAPHNPNGPLSTLASSHVCASVPNFFRQEFMFNDVPWRDTVIDHPISEMVYDGYLHLSDRPGLGVDLIEEELEKYPGFTTNAPDNFYI